MVAPDADHDQSVSSSSGYLFTVAEGAGPMERAAAAIVHDLAPGQPGPVAMGYAAGLVLAGRNLDRAETTRDSGRVDRALSRWVELLGKLGSSMKREGGAEGERSGPAVTEYDRYADAVRVAGVGSAELGNPPIP